MNFDPEKLQAFKDAYIREAGEVIDDRQAHEYAERVVTLLLLVSGHLKSPKAEGSTARLEGRRDFGEVMRPH